MQATPLRFLTILITIAALLLLASAACGDDDDGERTPSPAPNASLDAEIEQQFRELAGKWRESSAKVTYSVTNAAGEAEVVVYRKNERRRIDHTLGERTLTVIVREDGGYSCANFSNSCALLSRDDAVAAAELMPFVAPLAEPDGLNAIVAGAQSMEVTNGREIAGTQAICIKATGNLGGILGTTTFCFSEEGLLLAIEYEGGVPLEMIATAAGESEDTDLEPPYPVTTLPPRVSPIASP